MATAPIRRTLPHDRRQSTHPVSLKGDSYPLRNRDLVRAPTDDAA